MHLPGRVLRIAERTDWLLPSCLAACARSLARGPDGPTRRAASIAQSTRPAPAEQ